MVYHEYSIVYENMYRDVLYQHHPNARSNGCVFEHVLIAENSLGRYLNDGECVHHIDEDKHNNSPENLMVFRTQSDHARFHSGIYYKHYENDDGSWSCILEPQYCIVCGMEILTREDRVTCSLKCSGNKSRRCDRPSKEDLSKLLYDNSFLAVGKMFDVSDNAIRKWCKSYGMSTKAKDYK